MLIEDHAIYIQPINYPTVPRGTERLRITPTPFHGDELIARLASALSDVWAKLNLPRTVEQADEASGMRQVGGNAKLAVFPPAGG
ncbi:MAG: aminotransferase class I/II-fold pyridoxal phosphate-dependent enzyme, partial [Alphaproteobacteria bacterium]